MIALGTNFLGGVVVFVYFAFVESGLRGPEELIEIKQTLAIFLVVVSFITAGILGMSARLIRNVRLPLSRARESSDPLAMRTAVGNFLSLPVQIAVLSLIAWVTAGIIYACLHEMLPGGFIFPPGRTFRTLVAIVFVGAPVTVLLVYFVLEYTVRRQALLLFPETALSTVPASFRIKVLFKLVVVSLMIGTMPISVISYLTINQIHEIHAGYQSISNFSSHAPIVIGFLLSLAVFVAFCLSAFLALSVSQPLSQLTSAMKRIRDGHLDVTIPVVSNDEIGFVAEGFNRMVEGLRERDTIRETFGSYLSREVVEEILNSPNGVNLGGELREVTILVADLRGFTPLTASLPPEIVVKILNRYFACMVDIIFDFGGIVDEFTGDGILAFFGVPHPIRESQRQAVFCAMEMQQRIPELNRELSKSIPELNLLLDNAELIQTDAPFSTIPLTMAVVVHTGRLVVGNIGSEKRRKYGAVGTPINLTFRIEKKAGSGEILITSEVHERVSGLVKTEPIPNVTLKGIEEPVTLHRVVGLLTVDKLSEGCFKSLG